ncbi:hypothetical protein K0H71_21210 [Bacillus sp. IITD106]|nr:hypothetical protein [Bacillus sp. IITD106]
MGGKWRDFVLYDVDHCIPIKRREIKEVEMTDENIAEALYVINKSAKKSRDTKNLSYFMGDHSTVKRSKSRQLTLYSLKDDVINLLIKEGKAKVIGFHKQPSYNETVNYLILVKIQGLTFHLPVDEDEIIDLKLLGEIGTITAESRKTKLKFYESVNLLERYLKLK